MSEIYIQATGDYYETCASDACADLKQLVTDAVGQPVRRIDRFIQLALIGSGRCARAAHLAKDTALYMGSSRGDLEITIEVMQAVLRDGQPPRPLSFINTVSNAACFYVSQALRLESRSFFVCNRYFAFETVLRLALLDMSMQLIAAALIGTIDVVVPPIAEHRIRLGLSKNRPVADASHWLLLKSSKEKDTLGRLVGVENFPDADAFYEWFGRQPWRQSCVLGGGQFLAAQEGADLALKFACAGVFDYRTTRAYYDSQSGAAIAEFLRTPSKSAATMLHVNRDPDGRYCVMHVEKI
jgi:hypothetical protein